MKYKYIIFSLILIILSGIFYLFYCEYKKQINLIKNNSVTCEPELITTQYKLNELKKEKNLYCDIYLDNSNIHLCTDKNKNVKICVKTIN